MVIAKRTQLVAVSGLEKCAGFSTIGRGVMMKCPVFIGGVLAVLLAAGVAAPLELDGKAREMGLRGIAWDGTFTVYATDDELAKECLPHIREAYEKILVQLNQRRLRKKCFVFIWRNKDEFVRQSKYFKGGRAPLGPAFTIRNPSKKYYLLCALYSENLYDDYLPHELAHLVFPLFLDPVREVKVPRWLSEGFAQLQEKGSFDNAVRCVRISMKKGSLFSLSRLAGMVRYPRNDKHTFYEQSEVLVKLLIENQREAGDFIDFARALSCSKGGLGATLRRYYPQWPDLASLEKEYHVYVDRLARELP